MSAAKALVKTVWPPPTVLRARSIPMIQKILRIKNVGLFLDATPQGDVDLGRVVNIYSENGRGKTTLAAILRACADQDVGRINARKTIDSEGSIDISILVEAGAQTAEAAFSHNAWSGPKPSLIVFDSEFVDQNAYSGFEVRPDQRERLLEFALGDQPVQLKQKVEQLTEDIAKQTTRRSQAERTLTGFAVPYSLADFIALQQIPDAQQQIDALNARVEATRSSGQLNAREDPAPLSTLQFDASSGFATLGKHLEDVEQSAETIFRAHLAKHGEPGLEDWISRGQGYLSLDECPFCGQSLHDVELIRAYRSYFNVAYAQLKREVSSLEGRIATELSDNKIDTLAGAAATNAARIQAWRDRLTLDAPILNTDQLLGSLRQVRGCLLTLVSAKLQAPLEPFGSPSGQQTVADGLGTINQALGTYNSQVNILINAIHEFKNTLATENTSALQAAIRKLEAATRRQLPQVVAAVTEYQAADAERKSLESEKNQTRQQLDSLMNSTLKDYQTGINTLLQMFDAGFSIEQLKPNYAGGNPRSEYVLKLRNRPVALGNRADIATRPCFATILSDADKRTLAFAFFIAKLKTDPGLSGKVVILDDPVSSLDRNRRYVTKGLLCDLAAQCRQLIVLSHDPHFIRELHDKLGRLKPTPIAPSLHMIKGVQAGYSAFSACDLEELCSSDYYRHYKMLSDYLDGYATASSRDVAKAIRPTLEGYYHRRFPRRIPRGTLLSQIIVLARQAAPPDPLANLSPIIGQLTQIHDHASQVLHDTDSTLETGAPNEAELRNFAKQALDLIYQYG